VQQRHAVPPVRRLGLVAAALLVVACGASAPSLVFVTGSGSVTGDGLHRVRWSQLGAEFVKPGAQFGGYDKVLLEPLAIKATGGGERRRMGPVREYPPTPSYLEGLKRTYQETFAKQFGRRGWSVVSEPGPGVLRISGQVVDLVLTAPLDPEAATTTYDYVTSFGDLTLLLDVRDATSGEALLRTLDRQPISQTPLVGGTRNSTGANLGAQRLLFSHEAILLQDEIRQLQQLGTVPMPPQ